MNNWQEFDSSDQDDSDRGLILQPEVDDTNDLGKDMRVCPD